MSILIIFVGYILIFMAANIGRTKETMLKIGDWRWLLQCIMILIGVVILQNVEEIMMLF